jgi:heat shock protein HtpX
MLGGTGMTTALGLELAANLFSTHPATENRIAALHALAQEMGQDMRMAPQPGFVSPSQPSPWGSTTRRGPWG